MTDIELDDTTMAAVQRFNRVLARMPRFKIRTRLLPLVQSLLRLTQLRADRKLTKSGMRVEQRMAEADGVRVPVRVIWPAGPVRGVVLDIHGGGWVIGNAQMDDVQNAAIVRACQVAVVSVNYRLLPRATLQEAMDDCLAAARWLLGGGLGAVHGAVHGEPVFLLGESAGAHLAATVLLRLKSEPAMLAAVTGAVLYYGVYDLGGTPALRAAGVDTLVLDGPGLAQALSMLLPASSEVERRAPPFSPLYGDFAGLPPALMFAGGRDPLCEDTTALAQRWHRSAMVELHVIPQAPHGYLHFPTPLARIVPARTHAWLNERITAVQNAGQAVETFGA